MSESTYRSKRVESSQGEPHPTLIRNVRRQCRRPFHQPYRAQSLAQWRALSPRLSRSESLVLDYGCGVGESSVRLAAQWPRALVVGLDKSEKRLAKGRIKFRHVWPDNLCLVRFDAIDFCRLINESGHRVDAQYILYPNPWPKPAHLHRRWHGHPVFSQLLAIGGEIRVRSNWPIYLREFAQVAEWLKGTASSIEELAGLNGNYWSAFERKFAESGHRLFQLELDLGPSPSLEDHSYSTS